MVDQINHRMKSHSLSSSATRKKAKERKTGGVHGEEKVTRRPGWLAGSGGGGAIINHTYTREKKGRKKQSLKQN